MKKITFLSTVIVMILAACEKTIEFDYSTIESKQKIVIQAYLGSETGVNAYIYKSLPINNSEGDPYLQSPQVWIYCNDSAYAKLHETDSSLYCLADTVKLRENNRYKLVVEAEGFETAISNTETLLKAVTIDTIYKTFDSINWVAFIFVHFTDPNPEINQHHISIDTYLHSESNKTRQVKGIVNDIGYDGNKRIFYGRYYESFDSALVNICTSSSTLIEFEKSFLDYEVSYSNYMYETIFQVKSYITNGYGFLGTYEQTSCFYRKPN